MKTTFGDCMLLEDLNVLACGSRKAKVEPKTKVLFRYLVNQAPEVVTREQLLDHVWPGVNVSMDAFYRGIFKLRRSLHRVGAKAVTLETIPKCGYRMVSAFDGFHSNELLEPSSKTNRAIP